MKLSALLHSVYSLILILCIPAALAQNVHTIFVEIKTGDKRFAGTDDAVHFFLGGKDFNLDNPNHDDFERNNTDNFTLTVTDPDYSIEIIKAVGRIGIIKTGDSYFGGGWNFATIRVWVNDNTSTPIYTNTSVNKWLDGDHREWYSDFGETGWNLPEPPPFPPCTADDVIILLKAGKTEKADTTGKKPDSDCDGIPDDQDTSFDPNQPDSDNDGLPDKYEEQNGLDPHNSDTDGDGWADSHNVRDILILTKLQCLDEDGEYVEIGSDEIYLDAENVRFPLSPTLDNYWEMDDDTKVEPFLIVDSRVGADAAASPQYKTRFKLRESDITIAEKPTDDTFESFTLDWTRNDTKEMDFNNDSRHYKLSFKSVTTLFMDPSPTNAAGDNDNDGLKDSLEFSISVQKPHLRPDTVGAVDGYNGLASPFRKDLFVEVDATSSDDDMPFDAKQQVSSQFYYHDINLRLDDGFLGGGQILPYDESVDFSELTGYRNNHQWSQRQSFFKYALYVPSMGGSHNGRADRPGKKFMISRSTMVGSFSSIVFIHEMGHTLSLCHPIGTKEPPSPSPSCPTPANWDGDCDNCCFPGNQVSCCKHYCGVDDGDVTAMGDDIGLEDLVIGGAIGIMVGLAIIALFIPGIGWLAGAALLLGAALLGTIGGFFFSDAYLRIVDYHINEWAAIFLNF